MVLEVFVHFNHDLLRYINENRVLKQVLEYVRDIGNEADAAHDFSHIARVLSNAWEIAQNEGGDLEIIIAATLLHDIRNLPKDHPKTKSSSSLSARFAGKYLLRAGFPQEKIANVQDAIVCHSFSMGLFPKTLEGRILQDADRLDSLGAIGIARTFVICGKMGTNIYCPIDPLHHTDRDLADRSFAIDHFFSKLFKLPQMMRTPTGKRMAEGRLQVMRQYLDVLEREINPIMERALREEL